MTCLGFFQTFRKYYSSENIQCSPCLSSNLPKKLIRTFLTLLLGTWLFYDVMRSYFERIFIQLFVIFINRQLLITTNNLHKISKKDTIVGQILFQSQQSKYQKNFCKSFASCIYCCRCLPTRKVLSKVNNESINLKHCAKK